LHVAELSHAMDSFSSGNLDARATAAGSPELVRMARTFNATAGALVRARQRQAEYISTVIHDVRTPLTAIHLAVSYFDPHRPLPSESRIRDLVQIIERQLTRLNGLVGDTLNATWMEAGGELTLLRSELDLRAVASESVELFRGLAPQHVIALTVPEAPIALHGDRFRIEQVINNLLSNAVKYSALGTHVRVNVARAGDHAILTVGDEGPGVPPEDRERIFEPFQQRSPTHGGASGAALGLFVSKRVVEAHAGRMELESQVGRGSTFRIVLPMEPSSPEGVEAKHPNSVQTHHA
jgi:signal transduction histidine kinase